MSDALRIKPKAAPYRRAGVAFTSADEFVVFEEADLTPRQLAMLATDDELTLELQVGEDDWEPLPDEARAAMFERAATLTDGEWAEVDAAWSAQSGRYPGVEVELIDTLSNAVEESARQLDELGVDRTDRTRVIPLLIDLAVEERDLASKAMAAQGNRISSLEGEITTLTDQLQKARGAQAMFTPPAEPPAQDTTAVAPEGGPAQVGAPSAENGGKDGPDEADGKTAPAPAPKGGKAKSKAD